MIAPENVNFNVVHKIGTHIIQSMIGKHPFDVTIKKADLAVQIPAKLEMDPTLPKIIATKSGRQSNPYS